MAPLNGPLGESRRRRLWRSERGAELVEFALVFPTLLLVMLGIADFGFLFQRYEVITNAAREGARVAIFQATRTRTCSACQSIHHRKRYTWDRHNDARCPANNCGRRPVHHRSASHRLVRPSILFLGPIVALMGGSGFSNKTLHATSSMRSEIAAESCP